MAVGRAHGWMRGRESERVTVMDQSAGLDIKGEDQQDCSLSG